MLLLSNVISILRMELQSQSQGAQQDKLLLVSEAPELIINLVLGNIHQPDRFWSGYMVRIHSCRLDMFPTQLSQRPFCVATGQRGEPVFKDCTDAGEAMP